MSQFLTINNDKYFITIKVHSEDISFAMTNFKTAFREKISKTEIFERSKVNLSNFIPVCLTLDSLQILNQFVELENEKVLEIISQPSEIVETTSTDTTMVLIFKYKIAGVSFKFNWNLSRLNAEDFCKCLVLPSFDALLKLQKQIDLHKSLPDQDLSTLGKLPSYGCFDLQCLLQDGQAVKCLMELCKVSVDVEQDVVPVCEVKRPQGTPKRKRKGAVLHRLVKQNSKAKKPLYGDSQSSQET